MATKKYKHGIHQDVIIVGGGMVGATCALGLGKIGLKVQVIEKSALPVVHLASDYDIRISAISIGSVQLLKQLDAWGHIEQSRLCPYQRLETWEMDGYSAHFDCKQLNLPELGFMAENNVIQHGLWQAFSELKNITTTTNIEIVEIWRANNLWHVKLSNNTIYIAPLVIAADGAHSKMRELAGIGISGWQYRHDCMLITVETELEQQDITWQKFFLSGPRAFLPLLGKQACLAWYDRPAKIKQLCQLSLDKLADEIESAFPKRLGKIIKVQKRERFPLIRRHAQQYFKNGVVLVGDAAHTINPLAGQGVNLGFKDVKCLLAVIQDAKNKQQNLTDHAVLSHYQRKRKIDNTIMLAGMDVFYKGFKEDIAPLKFMRNLSLTLFDKMTPIKKQILKYALGL